MPASAVANGLVDAVLPVAQMPTRLLAYQQQMLAAYRQKNTYGASNDVAENLRTICELVHAGTGHDFSQYRRKS
jgi:two-component system CheB/CheR fusion protein